MAKGLNSSQMTLEFKADTSQAKKEMATLQEQLTKLMQASSQTHSGSKFTLTKEMAEATKSVAQLKAQLEAATNVDTGKLDLSKFSDSLRKSGMSLSQYQTQLNALGPSGQKAFAALAQSITQAEIPLRRSNALIASMWTSIKNTARWQLSSSILHGIMGAYQQAIGYAKDLNESLNNIRIVTGQNIDQMARFAEQANQSAKVLSTTTTAYTNAALIFYQQGLNDTQVKDRTDTVIKLANVSKQSAEVVSDQMTAIWNNFYDGSKSLEYYADVLTALGAATASSTEEIAGGLEKFAAIGETIGLSYEYAAAALATITSNTRQSEEVVGTALKTIFARIQGLNLGETLEDGTTLNKYSAALQSIGISIFDSAGQLKKMDEILNEMGSKWDTLNKSQQTALAQTVAGVRQYTQLISLMDNWDKGDSDSMQANLKTAYGAEGTLQNQADIYAESWEAASNRVKASAEEIYSALLNDEFFIDLNNTIADILGTIKNLITAFGGVKGVLTTLSYTLMTIFKTQMGGAIDNFIYSLRGTFGLVKKEMNELQNDATKLLMSNANQNGGGQAGNAIAESYKQQALYSKAYLDVRDSLSEADQKTAQLLQSQVNAMAEKVRLSAEELQNKERTTRALERTLEIEMSKSLRGISEADAKNKEITFQENRHGVPGNVLNVEVKGIEAFKTKFASLLADFKQGQKELGMFDQAIEQALDVNLDSSSARQELKAIMDSLDKCTRLTANMPKQIKTPFEALKAALKDPQTSAETLKQKWAEFNKALIENQGTLQKEVGGFQNLKNALEGLKAAFPNQDFSQLDTLLDNLQQELYETGGASQSLAANQGILTSMVKNLSASLKELATSSLTAGQTIMSLAQGLSSIAMAIQAAKGLSNIWNDDTISTGEKLLQTCITLGMVIPGVINGTKSLWSGLGGIVTGIKTHVIPSFTALSASTAGTGVAAAGASPGVLTFGASLQAALGPIGWISLALTALVGIFALIVVAVTNANSAQKQAEAAFKQATSDAQEAANALDNAKNAYENLKNTIEDYQGARNALNSLIEGTDEFKNKIQEANAYARELMETYGAQGTYNAETGMWEISEEEQDAAIQRYDQKLQAAQVNNATAQSNLRLANINKKNATLASQDDKGYWDYYGQSVDNTIGITTMSGAAVGTAAAAASLIAAPLAPFAGLIGAAIGAVSSLVVSFGTAAVSIAQQEDTNKAQIAALENLQAAYIENGGDLTAAKNAISKADLALINALDMTDTQLSELCQEVASNTAAIRENNKQIIDDYFKDNSTYKNSEHQDALSNLLATDLQNQTQNLYDTKWSADAGQYSDEEAQKLYAEKMGYTWVSDEENGVGKYADANGNELTIGDDQARMYLAQQEALSFVGQSIDNLNNNLNILANNTTTAGQLAYNQAAGGDITDVQIGMAEQGQQSFVKRDDNGNIQVDSNGEAIVDPEALQQYLGVDDATFEAIWKSKGYTSAEAYTEAFNQQLEGFGEQVANLDLVNQITGSGKLKLGTAQAFEEMLDNMHGEEAGQNFVNQFNEQLASKLNPEDYEEALGRLTNIDWSDWDAGEQAAKIMAEYGVSIDTTSESWQQFIQDTRNATLSTPDMDKLVANLSKIKEITSDLKVGDILSQEDYELLVKYNSALAGYFAILADGSAKMIGDPLDLQQAVAETTKKSYQEAAQAALNKADFYTKQYEAGLKAIGGDADNLEKYSSSVAFQNSEGAWKYYGSDAKSQLDFLESQGYGDTDEGAANLQRWRDDIEGRDDNGTTTTTGVLSEIGEAVASMGPTFAESAQQAQLWSAAYQGALNSIALGAKDAAERLELLKSGEINADAYAYAATAAHNEEKWEGMDPSAVQEYANALMGAKEAIEDTAEASKLIDSGMTEEVAEDVALYTKKMNQGVEKLSKNFKNWNSILKKSDRASEEYCEAMVGIKDAMSDVLGTSEEFISDKFILEHMEEIEKAATGNAEAIDKLRTALGKEIILDITADGSEAEKQALQAHANLTSALEGKSVGFTVTADMDTSGILTNAQGIIDSAKMTVEQAQAYFNSLGYEPTFVMEDQEVPIEGTRTYTDNVVIGTKELRSESGEIRYYDYIAQSDTRTESVPMGTQTVSVPALSADGTPQIESLHKTGGGAMNNNSSSNTGGNSGGGGGGGGSAKKGTPTKKSSVVDRYKEIDDKLDDQARHMDKASKAADRLWGTARINAMRAVNNQLRDNIDLLKKKRKEAQDNLITDKADLKTALKENVDSGLTDAEFASYFDEKGNFTQYDEILTDLYNEKSKLETDAGDEWDQEEQDAIQAVQDRIDAVKEAIEQYDETKELIQDMDEEIVDAIYEWQDNNYEILNLELELKVEINDANMELIEYYMSKIEDDVYASAEAFGYMNQQMGIYNSNLQAQDEYAKKLEEDYYAGKISLDAYKEGLRNVQSSTIENLQSLEEVKQSMREYYGEVLDMALEEIAIYTDEMENLNSVLDYYSNIMELIGKQDDTVTKGKILNSKANNLRNELNVQKKLYEESNAEAEKWAKLMSTAIEGSNEYETYKANWQAAQQAANDAQDAMLSKTEEWAEAMKAIIENELAGFGQELEKALTGGTSFDELLTSMERRSSLQEEYLTHTNKIYETNKLMRTAQQEIDKTTNSIAKKRLQSFIGETNELQNQKELSQYELEIQQAKYDLLLAEIAAEEARNAKSTVRLQRDSEGNMSYVYTADTDAVSAAQQELEDKQNALYNLGLEGANDYSQKYAETLQEAQDAITELTQMWMSGEISSEEEFNRRRAEIQEYYGEKLKQYSGLHQVALTTDSRVIADAWSTDFSDMIGKTNEWNTAVDSYFENAAKSMEAWSEVCATVLEDSGLNDLNGSLSEIDQKSQDLQTTLIGEDGEGGVVAAMMAEAKAAGELSKSYINVQNEIDRLIGKYEELLEKVNADYTNPDTPEVDPAIDPEETPEEETPTETPTEEPEETGPTYQTGTLTWTGNGASRVWKDSSGKTYAYGSAEQKAIQKAFDRAYSANYSSIVGHGYRGDYWLGGGKLDADVLHEKYGLATGGYTGDWEGSYGKLAFLHQKELVLNANDTENFLESMNVLERILQIIDLQALNSALGGGISVPTTGHSKSDILEQQVSIEAHFPNVTNHNEIEEAFNNLINTASQYANRKN